jgi:hypothetical protein
MSDVVGTGVVVAPGGPAAVEHPTYASEDVEQTIVLDAWRPATPLWFERGLVVAAAGVASFGAIGLLFAVSGHYRMLPVFALGIIGTALGSAIAWPRRSGALARERAVSLPAIGMCLVALAFAAWNGAHASEHVYIGRDPGVYTATGKWIASNGTLEVPAGQDWADKGADLAIGTSGTYPNADGTLEFQFNHLIPVLMAEADNLGGDTLMFRVPVVLSALGLCAIFAVGCRLVRRPWLVLIAVAGLAVSLPQLSVARDTLSESSVEFLLWAGIWLLVQAVERRSVRVGVLAGAVLGATTLARVDALVYLIPLPILAAVTLLVRRRRRGEPLATARTMLGVLFGLVAMVILGMVDLITRTGGYYHDLHSQVSRLQLALAASGLVAALALATWPLLARRWAPVIAWIRARRTGLGVAVAAVLGGSLAFAWMLRPAVDHPRTDESLFVASLQRLAGVPVDPGRTYAENSMQWLGWYLGPVAVALGIVGVAIIAARICRTPEPISVLVMAVAGCGTALYLWNPEIFPDQIWATRRYVPAALPLFALLAAVSLDALVGQLVRAGYRRVLPRVVAAAAVLGLVAFPLGVSGPVRDFRPQAGYAATVEATCRATGHDAAIVFLPQDPFGRGLASAVRAWCGVPVALLTQQPTAARVSELAAAWTPAGRTLWVLGSRADRIAQVVAGAPPKRLAAGSAPYELERALLRPPQQYAPATFVVYGSPIAH